jgi:hypothetical protein
MTRCDICDKIIVTITKQSASRKTILAWSPSMGWHGTCEDCRMVPVTGGGRFTFIRVGDL